MVASSVSICAVLLLLALGSEAASVYGESRLDSRLVRKERANERDSSGKLITEDLTQPKLKGAFCHLDFVLGQDDSNECNGTHSKIHSDFPDGNVSIDMCIEAAQLSNAKMDPVNDGFKIAGAYQSKHPKGCFKTTTNSKTWYFYNNNGDVDWPNATSTMTGTPICSRNKYEDGAEGSHGGCPDGYKVIMDEDTCEEMGSCLSERPNSGGSIGFSPHIEEKKLYPVGCFKASSGTRNLESGKVYWNAPSDLGKPNEGTLKGTPVCIVNTVLKWT
jgi:hypothetical protein